MATRKPAPEKAPAKKTAAKRTTATTKKPRAGAAKTATGKRARTPGKPRLGASLGTNPATMRKALGRGNKAARAESEKYGASMGLR